jgi:uncharacterized protein YqhQ
MEDRVRLGGLALENGVLVHGPTHWACAVRTEAGDLKVASGRKPFLAAEVGSSLLRGPARLAEVFALMPVLRRALPEARLPYERPSVASALGLSAFVARRIRRSRLAPSAREAISLVVSFAPAAMSLRGSTLAAYHGAEHIAIGSYEHGEPRTREHERCGSHLVGPLIVTSIAGSVLANAAPRSLRPLARLVTLVGGVAASVELFSWMVRNEDRPAARALAWPGHELQQHVLTAEPTLEQLEVAEAALAECLRLESPGDGGAQAEEAPPA